MQMLRSCMDAADIKLEACNCKPETPTDPPVWTKEALAFYANQRTTRGWKAIFRCSTCESLEVREGDAELAEEEDDRREDRGVPQPRSHIDVQGEEEDILADAASDQEEEFFENSEPEMEPEQSEGEEETEKQRREDGDFQFPSNPSTQSSTATEDEEAMRERGPERCMTKLESLSALASRYHWGHKQAVANGNAVLEDFGITGPKYTLDPAKLLRARISFGDLRTKKRLERAKKMLAIYFDERTDTTVIRETVTTKVTTSRGTEEAATRVQRTTKEEHCPVVMYGPDGSEVYIETHKLEQGKAPALAQKLVETLVKQESEDTVKVIGSDSCAKNTGQHSGVAACVELLLGRPLQRTLCLKHEIELVWHRFFKVVDGVTKGPKTLDGPIGKRLCKDDFYYNDIVNFTPIKPTGTMPDLSEDVVKKMSQDQKFLYRIMKAVVTGSEYFKTKEGRKLRTASPGKFHNARWITLAGRDLRMYCSTKPGTPHYKELVRMVQFLIDVYCPVWFDIVENPGFLEGPRCFQRQVARLNTFQFEEEELVEMKACINQNRQFFVYLCLPFTCILHYTFRFSYTLFQNTLVVPSFFAIFLWLFQKLPSANLLL